MVNLEIVLRLVAVCHSDKLPPCWSQTLNPYQLQTTLTQNTGEETERTKLSSRKSSATKKSKSQAGRFKHCGYILTGRLLRPALVAGWSPCCRLYHWLDGSSGRSVSPSESHRGCWGWWPGRADTNCSGLGPAPESEENLDRAQGEQEEWVRHRQPGTVHV